MPDFWLGPHASARGYRLHGYDSVGSTSTEAARAAAAGDVGDVWFAALQQTAGRGRRGRPWQTTHGNFAASLLVLPEVEPTRVATLGFVAGVALAQALVAVLPATLQVALKWPNDVLVDGAKLAGILLEAQQLPDRLAVVIGFGVNVVAAPEGLPYPATSLARLGAAGIAAGDILAALGEAWVECYGIWDNGRDVAGILELWRRSAAGIGSEIAISRDGDTVRGIFETIDAAGRLVVRAPDSRRIVITAGDVHFGATASLK